MHTELEVKILNINSSDLERKLELIGAKKLNEKNMRRFVYDFHPKKENSWIRLRFDGFQTSLTIKEIQNDGIDGTKELELEVGDFDKMNQILEKLGYKNKSYQENRRISYQLNNVNIELDFWPLIPPYIEIEGKSIEDISTTVKKLGYEMNQTTSINTMGVYKLYGIDISLINQLKF